MTNREEQYKNVHNEAFNLFKKKNADYGDAFATYGTVGVLVRMGDKISRLQSISKSGIVLTNNESLRDTLIDLHNYSAMALMLMDEEKEENKEKVTNIKVQRETLVEGINSYFGILTTKMMEDELDELPLKI